MVALTKFGVESSRFTLLVMVSLIVMGISAYFGLSKREDPSITIRTVVVSASFAGMDPIRVEELIADPIERKARQISEVKDIRSLITTGQAIVYLDLHDSVPSKNLTDVKQDIRNKMSEVAADLPNGASGPHVNTDYGDVAVANIAVTGHGYSYLELRESAKTLRKQLYTVPGVGKVDLLGEQEERIWLEINFGKLAAVGVQIQQVLDDLQAQNVILPAGEIDVSGTNVILTANGELKDVNAIRNVLTRISSLNTKVRLEDILTVRRGYVDPKETPVYFDGEPAIVLSVQMSDGQDIQVLGKNIKHKVAEVEQTQGIGIQYRFSTYQESKVTKSVNGALSNVVQTAAVVLLVLIIFLGWRSAVIVAFIVPFTVMFSVIAMGPMGIELQVVSIAAIIIALGLLVDNGLVIVEDIQNQINRGTPPKDASISASRQFSIPLAVASVTTVAAFLPLLLLEGTEGEYGYSMGAVVGIMLVGSWLSAIYLLPPLCVWIAKKQVNAGGAESALAKKYSQFVAQFLPLSALVVVACYGLVIMSGSLMSSIPNQMFPLSERNQFLIYVDMPKGTAISKTEEESLAIVTWLSNKEVNPEIDDTTLYVGDGGPRFYLSLSPADTEPSSAFILVNTFDYRGAIVAAERARDYLYEYHPAARIKIKRLSMGGSESGIVEVKISGPDADRLLALSTQVESGFAGATNISQNESDWGNKVMKVIVDISQDKARDLGITSQNISEIMDAVYSGYHVSELREGTYSIPIVLRAGEDFRNSVEDLQNLSLLVDGKLISLDQVANFLPYPEFSQLRRENQQRTIKVSAKSASLSAQALLEYIQPTLDELDLSGGYSIEIAGEVADSGDVNAKLGAGLPVALLVMLAAIMFQFNSVRRVVLVFLTIPLIIVGIPFGLLLLGHPLSFFGTLGMISLAGIIINNGIVLIDQIDIERKTQTLKQAIIVAAGKRVTPISLTTLTTVVGLTPMAINGGALFEPMASLMIGGLLLGSILTLLFVPAAFYLMFRRSGA